MDSAAASHGDAWPGDLPDGLVDEVDAGVALYHPGGSAQPLNAVARALGPIGLATWADLDGRPVGVEAFPPLAVLGGGEAIAPVALCHVPSGRVLRVSAAPLHDLALATIVDVSAEAEQHDELRRQFDGLRRLVASVGEHLFTVEVRNGMAHDVFTGTGASRLLGGQLPEGADPHAVWIEAMDPDDRSGFLAAVAERARGVANEVTYRLRGFDGRVRWVLDRGYPSPTGDGAMIIDGVAVDVTDMRRLAAQLEEARREAERRSRIDSLTEAFNRRHFGEVLGAELARAAGGRSRPGVILLDVDHFKQVNDTYGHHAGDAVLIELTRRLHAGVREFDCVARYGGEEFAVLVPDITESVLRRVAEALGAAVRDEPFVLPGGERVRMTVSLGAACAPHEDAGGLLAAADRALYAAKRRGRDRACLAEDLVDADLAAEEPETMRLARALSLSASLREQMPEGHDEAVADLAGRIAEALDLQPDAVLRCRLGGLLHDIGKIAIPDAVLTSTERLDPAGDELLRTHPAVGEELALRVPGLAVAAPAIRHHHEHVDGSGYPDALRGDAIPVEARIVAAADVFASFGHGRGTPVSDAERLAEVCRLAGSRLDARVVGALVDVTADGLAAAA